MVDANWATNRIASAAKKYGTAEPSAPLPIPDVVVGDKVKVTTDDTEGTIERIIPRAAAFVTMPDGSSRYVPLGYLEKVV